MEDHIDIINQLESILTHLKRLQSEIYINLLHSSEVRLCCVVVQVFIGKL